jgi:hypothetical protein
MSGTLADLTSCASVSCFIQNIFDFLNTLNGGLTLPILFVFTQLLIYLKLKDANAMAVIGVIFLSYFAYSQHLPHASLAIIISLIIFELGIVLYNLLFR